MRAKVLPAAAAVTVLTLLALGLTALIAHSDALVSERTVGNMTVEATPPSVNAGGVIRLTLTVTGPAQYENCRPVAFWANDAGGQRAWREVQFWACPPIKTETLAAGERTSFGLDLNTIRMAPGRYTVHGAFGFPAQSSRENVPVVTFEIRP